MKPNTIGVYQGGSLSCVLYSLFSNDLGLHVDSGVNVVQYADDVQVLTSGKKQDLPRIVAKMEDTLNTLFQWFCQHHMKVNERKTQVIVIGTPAMLRDTGNVTITFNGSQIHDSETVRNLGVTMDKHLNYQAYIDALTGRCTGALIALNNARHVIPSRSLATLAQTLVISVVHYCISVYGTCNATQLKRVQKVINFCARVVSGRNRHDHISDVLKRLGWLNARQLVEYHTIGAVQSAVGTGLHESISSAIGLPASDRHSHETRGAGRLTVPRIRTEAGRRRLCYRGVTLLNACSAHVNDPHQGCGVRVGRSRLCLPESESTKFTDSDRLRASSYSRFTAIAMPIILAFFCAYFCSGLTG